MRIPLFLILSIIGYTTMAQVKNDSITIHTRNFIATTPVSRNADINGLAIGVFPGVWGNAKHLKIDGMSVSAAPWDFIPAVYSLFYGFNSLSRPEPNDPRSTSFNTNDLYDTLNTKGESIIINGLMIGDLNASTRSNGVSISTMVNASIFMNGISVSGMFNHNYSFKGLLIAGLRNKTTTGRGMQIALFNSCNEGRVVQIGLVNKTGKRIRPFFNCRMRG